MRSFFFRSKDKVWLWVAMNRETREIVASGYGDRTENTCRILWDRVPSACKEAIVFSDYWSAYRAVIPSEQQRPVGKETEETAHIERWNNTLRKQLACFENSSYTDIIPNYCRLLARYHFKNHRYRLGEDSLLGHAVPRRVVNARYCTLELPRSRANKKS